MANPRARDRFDPIAASSQPLLDALDRGEVPWQSGFTRKNWMPRNATTGIAYNGWNLLLLAVMRSAANHPSSLWLTYKQAEAAGGHVRKGQHGIPLVKWVEARGTQRVEPADGETPAKAPRRRLMPWGFTVFNLAQTEGVTSKFEETFTEDPRYDSDERLKHAEAYFAALNGKLVEFRTDPFTRAACYWPEKDFITMPSRNQYAVPEEFYKVLAHECAHATGHPSRLNRGTLLMGTRTGSPEERQRYAREELTAEICAFQVASLLGLDTSRVIENSAAYTRGWRARIQEDPGALMAAAQASWKATAHLVGLAPEFFPPGILPAKEPIPNEHEGAATPSLDALQQDAEMELPPEAPPQETAAHHSPTA